MNKQALFQKAHATARQIVSIVGDYMVAFKIALKKAWSEIKMTVEFTAGVAQNGTPYIEAAPGSFQAGDIVTDEFRFKAYQPTRKRRGGRAAHPAGTMIRKLKVTGMGKEFDAMTDLSKAEPDMRQRFYCEIIDEQKIYDAE